MLVKLRWKIQLKLEGGMEIIRTEGRLEKRRKTSRPFRVLSPHVERRSLSLSLLLMSGGAPAFRGDLGPENASEMPWRPPSPLKIAATPMWMPRRPFLPYCLLGLPKQLDASFSLGPCFNVSVAVLAVHFFCPWRCCIGTTVVQLQQAIVGDRFVHVFSLCRNLSRYDHAEPRQARWAVHREQPGRTWPTAPSVSFHFCSP